VWKHTATYLPLKYIISSFWAGQEGSFLLWVLIEGLLGMVLLFTSKKFEGKVMTVLGLGQFLLTTMILGIKPLGLILGQSPFVLLREETNNIGSQFFQNPDYLSQIIDGNGINPLLENIWMVTHPPLLFLGYSASVIPFAFAIASLWSKDYKSWLKPAFPWTVFSVLTLGGGILLGGAWAYESLTFGGFWAWDPVENASLIPWLVILAGMHMMILNKKRNHSFGLSYIFIILGYTLVVYASYLTRSGVLGATSVHAFGNNGLSTQMILIIAIVIITSLILYFRNYKNFPKNQKDEFLSREFWMYIGSLILVLSSFQVFISTSIPVINKVFGTNIAPPVEVVAYYNKWQLPMAILIVIFISVSLILKYGKNDFSSFMKRFGLVIIVANVLFLPEIYLFQIDNLAFLVFLLSINLAIVGSLDYLIRNKFNIYNLSNSVSHFGFALFLLGVLAAFSNSQIISKNTSMYDLGDANSNSENQLLEKDKLKQLNKYLVEYSSLKKDKNHMYYGIDFYTKDKNGELKKDFSIEPSINVNSIMGNVYDPDTYHSLKKDVFTYISYADIKADQTNNRYKELSETEMQIGDTLTINRDIYVLRDIRIEGAKDSMDVNNVSIIATIEMPNSTDSISSFDLAYRIINGRINKEEKDIPSKKLRFRFVNISTKKMGVVLGVDRKEIQFIVIKSVIFPYISLMWIGALIMLAGLFISLYRNIKLSLK
jgi:cytochrome c-type biogenesis protein CcmF